MIWQDYVITFSSLLFSISLIPQVTLGFKKRKSFIARGTSIPTFIGLYILSITFFTLKLFISGSVGLITASLWLILFIQSVIYNKA